MLLSCHRANHVRREKLVSSLSHYELGRRFWHDKNYQRSLDAVEVAVALKLFPYQVGGIYVLCIVSASSGCRFEQQGRLFYLKAKKNHVSSFSNLGKSW